MQLTWLIVKTVKNILLSRLFQIYCSCPMGPTTCTLCTWHEYICIHVHTHYHFEMPPIMIHVSLHSFQMKYTHLPLHITKYLRTVWIYEGWLIIQTLSINLNVIYMCICYRAASTIYALLNICNGKYLYMYHVYGNIW